MISSRLVVFYHLQGVNIGKEEEMKQQDLPKKGTRTKKEHQQNHHHPPPQKKKNKQKHRNTNTRKYSKYMNM